MSAAETRRAAEAGDYQRRAMAELDRLARRIQPGCMSLWVAPRDEAPLVEKLTHAQIALLLAAGPQECATIYDYVPPPLAPFILGPRPRTIEQAVRLVALNLDWYLEPPHPLWRAEWLWLTACCATLIWATVDIGLLHGGLLFTSAASVLAPLAAGLIVWIGNHGDVRRARTVRAMRTYLRITFQVPQQQ